MSSQYQEKYIKYKNKYLNLKNQTQMNNTQNGGNVFTKLDLEAIEELTTTPSNIDIYGRELNTNPLLINNTDNKSNIFMTGGEESSSSRTSKSSPSASSSNSSSSSSSSSSVSHAEGLFTSESESESKSESESLSSLVSK